MIGYYRCHLFTVKRESGWRVRRRESKPVYLSNVWDSEPVPLSHFPLSHYICFVFGEYFKV